MIMVGCADIVRARCNTGAAALKALAVPQPEYPKIVRP
jgi:hypothetical protein